MLNQINEPFAKGFFEIEVENKDNFRKFSRAFRRFFEECELPHNAANLYPSGLKIVENYAVVPNYSYTSIQW